MNEQNELISCKCFRCEFLAPSAEDVFAHASEKHNLDVLKLVWCDGTPDQLDYVRLVNFLRKNEDISSESIMLSKSWKDDKYLTPALENDPLLYFDVESCAENEKESGGNEGSTQVLKKKLEKTEAELLEAKTVIEKMKESVHKWLGEFPQSDASNCESLLRRHEKAFAEEDAVDVDDDDDEIEEHAGTPKNNEHSRNGQQRNASCRTRNGIAMEKIAPVDSSYFCSYAGYSVHKDMLQDTARTLAYLNFIKTNKALFEGKVVIDVGCGTGILSMFAVRYGGARKVFALEPSKMAFQAIDTIAENGINPDAITVINAPVESSEVARVLGNFGEKADIVISEWMGYFMIFENMLPSVIYARDKFMRPDGFMAPSKADLFLDATDSTVVHQEFVGFWDDVYGFSMQKMKRRILMDSQLFVFEKSDIVSTAPSTVMSLNLNNCPAPAAHHHAQFDMKFTKSTKITAFVGWFTVDFEGGSEDVCLSTAPGLTKTHWQQTALLLPEPVAVEPNESYPCSVNVSRCENDHRSISISVKFMERTYRWALCRD